MKDVSEANGTGWAAWPLSQLNAFDDRIPQKGSRYIFDSPCSQLSVLKLPVLYSVAATI